MTDVSRRDLVALGTVLAGAASAVALGGQEARAQGGFQAATSRPTRRLQRASVPRLSSVFARSYLGAIRANIRWMLLGSSCENADCIS